MAHPTDNPATDGRDYPGLVPCRTCGYTSDCCDCDVVNDGYNEAPRRAFCPACGSSDYAPEMRQHDKTFMQLLAVVEVQLRYAQDGDDTREHSDGCSKLMHARGLHPEVWPDVCDCEIGQALTAIEAARAELAS